MKGAFSVERLSFFLLNSHERMIMSEKGYVFRYNMIILDRDRIYPSIELGEIMEKYCKQFSISDVSAIKAMVKAIEECFSSRRC